MWIISTIVLVIILLYIIFGGFTFYWAVAGYPALEAAMKKSENEQDITKRVTISWGAKFMYYHGIAFIIGFVFMAILLFAFGGAMVIARYVVG